MKDPLFPELPEDLSALSDEDLATLKREHEIAAELIDADDEDFIKGMEADEVLAAYEAGVAQIEAIVAEQKARVEAEQTYLSRKDELAARRKALAAEKDEAVEAEAETLAAADESENEVEETDEEPAAEEAPEVVVASAEPTPAPAVKLRRPPAPAADRLPTGERQAVLVAAAGVEGVRPGQAVDRIDLAKAYKKTADRWGRVAKHDAGIEQRILVASASFDFPESRKLHSSDWEINAKKIAEVVPLGVPGVLGNAELTASGGLCAPLTPFYSMPNFAVQSRPVRDALPSFMAERGGVNVPTATTIGDITSAITVIEEADDALGGTYATKSCQDMECPSYTEVPVTVISHCREYGNLNSMAWPEKIAHENDLTMAAHARAAEGYLLDRIKALSINVTNGAETLGALVYLVDGIVKAAAGMRYRLRMNPDARFRALLPSFLPDLLVLDTVQTQFDRFQSKDQLVAYLRGVGIEPTFYLDTPSTGTSQGFSAETASALDGFPDNVQWAIYPEGTFIHVDSGSLELGIVRDSTLNSTNDYQFFGETFENVARLGPEQAALWVTSDLCANGQFPPAGTARTCD